jgi:hypothetical protein
VPFQNRHIMWNKLIALFYSFIHTQSRKTATKAKALVLHCIDFRFIDLIHTQLNIHKLHNNYDEIILAGTSLHINCTHEACSLKHTFTDYFNTHVQLAHTLHDIQEIWIIEHEQCLAYKRRYSNYDENPIQFHMEEIRRFHSYVKSHDSLKKFIYKYYFIRMDNTMEELHIPIE